MSPSILNIHERYHAHVYFDAQTAEAARQLCAEAGSRFGVAVGRMHERPVGPHPMWSCQLAFDRLQFDGLIPWLDANRGPMDVLVHGLSGDDFADHTAHASWLGHAHGLKMEMFGRAR